MEFLKTLFGDGPITFDQFVAKAAEAKMNLVNLADGGYVSKAKYDDNIAKLTGQVNDLKDQVAARDTDLSELKTQLEAVSGDASKFADAQKSVADLQAKYDAEKKDWENRMAAQQVEFAIREQANSLKFSSNSAKSAFISDAMGKGFKLDNGKLLGFNDFVESFKTADPSAFAAEVKEPEGPKPTIVLPGGQNPAPAASGFAEAFHFQGVRPQPK